MQTIRCITLLLFIVNVQALKAQTKTQAESIDFTAGGTFGKVKALANPPRIALAQLNVTFKQISTKAVTHREKKMGGFGKQYGKAATASVTSYLETSDGELAPADYQEVVNHFYAYFQQQLKKNGIDTVAWSKISKSEFYQSQAEKNKGEEKEENEAQVSYLANNGTMLFGTGLFSGWGFLKMKKAGKLCEELDATLGCLNVTVDFAQLDVNAEVKTGGGYQSTWTPGTSSQVTTMKSQTKVMAVMRVATSLESKGNGFCINEKLNAETVSVNTQIPAEMDYATEMLEDASRAEKRNKYFSVSFSKKLESTPVVIVTTKENYKTAAKKALENYANAFVAKVKSHQK